jgi:hypothetical protein
MVLGAGPAGATMKYGPIELSGSVDSQTLLRSTEIDQWQFIQNRNTALIRLDYNWLQNGRFIDRYNLPFIKRSKLYLLYRGTYDSFWGIAPGGRQKGVTVYDDMVGGPIIGHTYGTTTTNCPAGGPNPCTLPGIYSSLNSEGRNSLAWTNTLREAYVDLTLADVPLSFRFGRQQVVWGESDQFRLMDIINPLDITWHLQQEDWDKIRIPLWMIKGIWDLGDIGPVTNAFAEVVWNPGDFSPGVKVQYLPAPWSVPVPNPVRSGQILLNPGFPVLLSPQFNLQGTSFRQGDFSRTPGQASEVGFRVHGVTDIPLLHMQGLEFTANYFYGRARGIGAVASNPFALRIEKVTIPFTNPILQGPNGPPATFNGMNVFPADVTARFVMPFTNIFGVTGNYFESNFTNAVFRLEMAYQIDAPFQSASLSDRVIATTSASSPTITCAENAVNPQPGVVGCAPIGYTTRDVWAGMLGFDRPTWIKFLNRRNTFFITGQFFWSYVAGNASDLRGAIETASEAPYFTPPASVPTTNGFGQWNNGPFAGQVERTQNAAETVADRVRQWELLTTLAATSFYAGGSIVPSVAIAIDPVNRNFLSHLTLQYFYTNDLILELRENFYNDLGSGRPSLDPWGAGGINARRDETGIKITYQF